MLGDEIASAADTEARGQVGLHFCFRKGCTVAPGISWPKQSRRQWASPARCGRLLAQTNPASAAPRPSPHAGQAGGLLRCSEGSCDEIASAVDTEARGQVGLHFCFRKGRTVAPGISRPKQSRRQWASPARCGRLLAQTNPASAAHTDPPPCWTGRGVIRRAKDHSLCYRP
jgi:hypothetical protein